MADDKFRNQEPEVEGHKKAAGVEERAAFEPEDKVRAARQGLNEEPEPEVEGHMKRGAGPERAMRKA